MAKQNLPKVVQKKMKQLFDCKAKFFGPCNVIHRVLEQNCLIKMLNKRKSVKVCHVNFLKPYFACDVSTDVVKDTPVLVTSTVLEEEMSSDVVLQPRLKNSETLAKLGSLLGYVEEDKWN